MSARDASPKRARVGRKNATDKSPDMGAQKMAAIEFILMTTHILFGAMRPPFGSPILYQLGIEMKNRRQPTTF
jgi:hypothetical protein